uniref:NYN domain-containing protein n=1 Tax=Noccaea caerulescens TaxID=107243 RepID=A0A1J3IEJ4_NOCCA
MDSVMQKIINSARVLGHRGHVSVSTYGDMTDRHFPSEAGVKLNHFPAGEQFAKETKMLEDVVAWAGENPSPSTLMIVTGDVAEELVDVVQLLKTQKNYKVLNIHPRPRPTMVVLIPPGN